MKFHHPEEIMRAKMLGLIPRCKNCTYFKAPPWCSWRKSDEAPGTKINGYDICSDFIVRRPG